MFRACQDCIYAAIILHSSLNKFSCCDQSSIFRIHSAIVAISMELSTFLFMRKQLFKLLTSICVDYGGQLAL